MKTCHLPAVAVLAVLIALATPAPGAEASKGAKGHRDLEEKLKQGVEQMDAGREEEGAATVREALAAMETAAAKSPKDARLLFLIGKAHFYLGEDDEASAAYERAIALAPREAEFHFMKGVLLNYREQPEEAVAALETATKLAPKNAEYWFELGTTFARSDKADEATAAFQKAVAADPKHAESILMLGVMKMEAGDEAAALAAFEKAGEADPEYANAHRNVGQLHQNHGRHEEALAAFRRVVEVEPDDWRARAKLVQELQALGRTKERDAERKALFELHTAGKVDSPFYCREQFTHAAERVMAFEHFELKGERALRYVFQVLEEGKDEPKYKISLGSYESTNEFVREKGEIGPDEWLFHLDGYYPDGEHRTFGFYEKEPTYEQTRTRVTAILDGKVKPLSSSKRQGDDFEIEVDVDGKDE